MRTRRRARARERRRRRRVRRLPRLRRRRAALAAAERRAKLIELRDERLWSTEYGGPADWLERSIEHLATHTRAVSPGTFVFLLSDFIPSPSYEMWLAAIEHRWDVVPIVIQDPTWEQSFPDVDGIVVPLRDPRTGRVSSARLRRKEVAARREENGRRTAPSSRRSASSTSIPSSSPRAIARRSSRSSSSGPTSGARGA